MPRGLTRRLPALLAVPVLAAALAGGCADEAAAARVGDTTISNDDLMSDVKDMAGNEVLLQTFFNVTEQDTRGLADADKSYSQPYVGLVLRQRIINLLVEGALAAKGVEVTDDDLEAAERDLPQALEEVGVSEDDLTKNLRNDLIRQVALGAHLQDEFESEDEYRAAIGEQALETDIEISSKYGTWDEDQLTIIPPAGPVQVGGESDSTVPGDL